MKQKLRFNVEATGIGLQDWVSILDIFEKNNFIEKVILYGSRAKGCYKKYSDIDLTVFGSLTLMDLQNIENHLYELNLPYIIDLSNCNSIKNSELLDHINQIGILVYEIVPI